MEQYTISSPDLEVTVIPYGATVTSIKYKGKEMILGYRTLDEYKNNTCYIGAFVGRYANRIKNGSAFIGDVPLSLDVNNGENHLHGGFSGMSFKEFTVESCYRSQITLSVFSPENECGYPANLKACIKYSVQQNSLFMEFWGETDGDTIFAPTSHIYFNLGKENIMGTQIQMDAAGYIPVGKDGIPLSSPVKADGEFDFSEFKPINRNYDHCFVLNKGGKVRAKTEEVCVTLTTDFPGVQLYTGEFLTDGFAPNAGFALEPEFFPDSPNMKDAPSPILKKGQHFNKYAVFTFSHC